MLGSELPERILAEPFRSRFDLSAFTSLPEKITALPA